MKKNAFLKKPGKLFLKIAQSLPLNFAVNLKIF